MQTPERTISPDGSGWKCGNSFGSFSRMASEAFQLDFDEIKRQIHRCLCKSFELLDAPAAANATSYGVSLDTRFGRLTVGVNHDDDASYRCTETSSFTGWGLCGADLALIEELREHRESLDCDSDLPLEVCMDGSTRLFTGDEFERFLYEQVLQWVKKALSNRAPGKWLPYWVHVEEVSNGRIEFWRCRQKELPAERAWTDDLIEGQRIEAARESGVCVYQMASHCRKYIGMNFEQYTRLDGDCIQGTALVPLRIQSYTEMLRQGDLARVGYSKEFAVNLSRPKAGEVKRILGDQFEFVPFEVDGIEWEFCNCTAIKDVLNHETTRFEPRPIGDIRRIEEIEFDESKLRALDTIAFRVAEWSEGGVFLLSSPERKGLLEFCEQHGLRGLGFNLVWTNATLVLHELAEEFRGLVIKRLCRVHGNADVRDAINVECLYGYQKDLWRLLEARRILREEGARNLVEKVQGLRDIKNPIVRNLVPESWWWFNKGDKEAVAERLAQEFANRDLLEGMNGYLSRMLPKAIRDIREMEATNSGRRAVFGPEV